MPGAFNADDSVGARLKAAGRALLAFLVLPNLLFLLAGVFLFTTREPVNLDYVWLGAAWLWLPRWLRVAAFAVLFMFDAVSSTAAMYNINPLAGIVALARAPAGLLLTVVAGTALAVACAVYIATFALRVLADARRRYLVLALMLAVLMVSVAAGIGASGVLHFARELRDRVRSASARTFPVAAATDPLFADIESGDLRADNVVVIMIESMGVLRDSTLRALVWAPLETPAIERRYHKRSGDIEFRGGTTSGELRELCGIFADYITLPPAVLPRCLPRRLRARGFTTFAVHGYRPEYYDRNRWYPLLFDSVYFENELDRANERRCGTQFRGICDRDAFVAVERLAHEGQRRLIYWMTLDAHTPVDVARRPEFSAEWAAHGLDGSKICRTAPEVCLQALFWRDLLRRVAAMTQDTALPPTRFLLVGDHAPAFVRRERAWGYEPGRVPFLELIPRQ